MLFNSFSFLAFFAALVVVYYAVQHRFRWPLLVGASLFFYATFDPRYVPLLLVVSAIAYAAALGIEAVPESRARRLVLSGGIVVSLAPLVVLKYSDFFAASFDALIAAVGWSSAPAIPRLTPGSVVGLSFYTFSCISYLADVYAGRLRPARHLRHFILYVSFFPKLLAGPIERAGPFLSQVSQPVRFSTAGVTTGLQLMLWGLFKKVVIADRLATVVDNAYRQPAFASPADLVIATYFFAFQIYCDFSGYSDIAIGAAKVLGLDLMENFRRPYLSTSVTEFWGRRWHLSLATWFRDYMYIPMGGNRVSRLRQGFNLMAVFLVSGLWHGANWTFIIWGGLNGAYYLASVVASGRQRHAGAFLRALATFHLILITWVFFRAASVSDAAIILSRVARSLPILPGLLWVRLMGEMLLPVALIAALLAAEAFDERRPLWMRLRAQPIYVRWAVYYALLVALVVLGAWNVRQFVYMQF